MKWIALALVLVLLFLTAAITFYVQMEAPFHRQTLASAGARKALILFHPSRDAHFSDDLTEALSRGFVESGLSVERWPMTGQTPANLANFTVVALVSNTFFWAPDWPTQRYLKRARFHSKPVIAVIAGAGHTERAQRLLSGQLEAAGAKIQAIKPLWISRPNAQNGFGGNNRQIAMRTAHRIAREAGRTALAQR